METEAALETPRKTASKEYSQHGKGRMGCYQQGCRVGAAQAFWGFIMTAPALEHGAAGFNVGPAEVWS